MYTYICMYVNVYINTYIHMYIHFCVSSCTFVQVKQVKLSTYRRAIREDRESARASMLTFVIAQQKK
jgi:hypothetical protein